MKGRDWDISKHSTLEISGGEIRLFQGERLGSILEQYPGYFKRRDCVISWRGVRSFQGEGLGSVSWICQGGIRLFEGEGFD